MANSTTASPTLPSFNSYFESQQMTSKCQHLSRYLDSDGWCKKCTMKNVSSGHSGIDKFIKRTQNKATNWSDPYLEWISYDQFQDIKEIGQGNFSVVYSATWTLGKRVDNHNSSRKNKVQCPREGPMTVTLKRIKNSQEMTRDYIKQLKVYYRCSLMHSKKHVQELLEFYGITKDPETNDFILVTQFTPFGNLRNLLNTNFSSFQWSEKIWWLCDIVSNLHNIHKAGYIHGNIHPGNILQIGKDQRELTSTLADTGLSLPANNHTSKIGKKDVYGVLPYMAPEVILGHPRTKESDIYSIGILMIELSNGILPFSDRHHNSLLALEIIKGLRPQISQDLPQVYINLALDCCHKDPSLRPNAKQLLCIFNCWWEILNRPDDNLSGIRKSFMTADDLLPMLEVEKNNLEINSGAFYTSRLLQFEDVSKRDSSSSDISDVNY